MSETRNKTLFILKPDTVRRNLMGSIITRIEQKGFKIVGCRMDILNRDLAAKHYEEHNGKDFFEPLVAFMTSGPILLMVVEADNAVIEGRKFITDIRKDFSVSRTENVIHASDSIESAEREIELFFPSER